MQLSIFHNKCLNINVLCYIELSSRTICKRLKNLKPEKSPRIDNIYPVVLCNLASVLSISLCSIHQQSIECNIILEDWKLADITPLFTKGSGVYVIATDLLLCTCYCVL